MRWPAIVVLTVAVAAMATVAGAAVILPVAAYALVLPLLAVATSRSELPELWLFGALVLGQCAIVGGLVVASAWGIEGLGLMVLPVVVASMLLPPRMLVTLVTISVLIMLAAAGLVDPERVSDEPPVLLLPLGVLLCVAVPGAAVRALDETSRGTAIADSLTGALNRMALEARIGELMSTSRGRDVPVGVIIADLDHFKRVNDDHGHDTGDLILCGAVDRLRDRLDRFTPLYRVGGEEFIVLVPGASVEAVAELAEQLRASVADEPIHDLGITMSFGVASGSLSQRPFHELLAEADQALYVAKNGGRNRVVQAVEEPVAELRAVGAARREAPVADAAGVGEQVVADPSADRLDAARELLGNGNGSWLVRDELERDHVRDLVTQLHRTHNAAFAFVFAALVASIPWLGWKLFVPAAIVIPGYVAVERNLHRFKRPETALMLAWICVQLSMFGGAVIVPEPAAYQLLLMVPMLVGTAAVFPARGVVVAGGATVLIMVASAFAALPDLIVAQPGLAGGPVALVVLISLASAVTGRSALDHRAGAVVDPLTGLLNRAALAARVAELAHLSEASKSRVAVVVCDLDGFKGINDTRGHGVGDEVIRTVGETMRTHLRGFEWAFRLGGDEFVVLLPYGVTEAVAIAERLRAVIADLEVNGVVVTGSFGVAASQANEVFDFDRVFQRADAALYEAKRAGRNRVETDAARLAAS